MKKIPMLWSSEIRTYAKASVRKWAFLLLLIGYFLLWLFPRWSSVAENTLHMDDFLIADQNQKVVAQRAIGTLISQNVSCSLPPQDGRWVLIGLLCPLQEIEPVWSLQTWPKIFAGLAVSVTAASLALIFIRMGTPPYVSALLPLLLLSSPLVSEISLWNTCLFISIALLLTLLALSAAQRDRAWSLALVALFLAAFIYEIYITIFLVGAMTFYVVRAYTGFPRPSAGDLRRVGAFLSVCCVYLGVLIASRWLGSPGRGLIDEFALNSWIVEKTRGALNLLVNAYLPVIGIYHDTSDVYSWWKLGPAAMLGLGVLAGLVAKLSSLRIFVLALFLLLLPMLPTLPLFAASQSPESWRVSVPILIAFLFALACVSAIVANAAREHRGIGVALFWTMLTPIIVGASALQFSAAREESRLRVLENEWDRATFAALKSFWQESDQHDESPVSVIRVDVGALQRVQLSRAQHLTVAYGRRGVNSAFGFEFSWSHFLRLSAHGAGITLNPHEDAYRCSGDSGDPCLDSGDLVGLAQQCKSEWSAELFGFRWVHLKDRRLSAVCV